jgi:hypothetical protein
VGTTAGDIIRSQILVKVLISMKVSDSHLYHILDNLGRLYAMEQEILILYVCLNVTLYHTDSLNMAAQHVMS